MITLPLISIITVSRNAENTLEKAIKSVISQSYKDVEYIIIDGGSTDRTVDIIKAYSAHIVYWQSKPDCGGNDAYNIGLQHATGDIVCFLNADDWYENNVLHEIANLFIEKQQPDIITCHTRIVKRTKEGAFQTTQNFNNPSQLKLILKNILFVMPLLNARFFKRSFFNKIGIFRALDKKGNYLISADRELLIRASRATEDHVVLNKLGYTYLAHADSQTMSTNRETLIRVLKEHLQICKEYLKQDSLNREDKALFRQWRNNQLIRLISARVKNFFKKAL